jgi:hypothetical protein
MYYSSMEPSQSSTKSELTLLGSVRSGTVSGLVAAWAIFGMILAVGAQLGLPPGTFYQMVGVSLGIDEERPAIYLGFVMHMITGAIIGIVYMIISDQESFEPILLLSRRLQQELQLA